MRYIIITLIFIAIACDIEQYGEDLPCSGDEIICLFPDSASFSANGIDIASFTAYLPMDANDTIEKITFKVPADSGLKSLENDSNVIVKAIDIKKSASASFRAGFRTDNVPVQACVMLNSKEYCSNTVYLEITETEDSIFVHEYSSADLNNLIADGISFLRIDTEVKNFSSDDNTLMIDLLGPVAFVNNMNRTMEVMLDAEGKSQVNLKFSDQFGSAEVGFDYNGKREKVDLEIKPALPDEIILISDSTSISPLSTIPLKIYIDRQIGNFSQKIPIRINVWQEGISSAIGQFDPPFLQTSEDVSGSANAEVVFRLNDVQNLDENLPIIFQGLAGFAGDEIMSEPLTINFKK